MVLLDTVNLKLVMHHMYINHSILVGSIIR